LHLLRAVQELFEDKEVNIQEVAVTKARAAGTTLELVTATGIIKLTMSGVTDELRKVAIELANYGWRTFAYIKGVLYRNGVKMPSPDGVHSFSVTFTHTAPA
jgi:hypothetical protein